MDIGILKELPAEEPKKQVVIRDGEEAELQAEEEEEHGNLGCLDSFCSKQFFGFINSPAKYIFPLVLLIWAIVFGVFAGFLQPTSEADQILRQDHPFQRFIDSSNEDFGVSTDSRMKPILLVFGLENPPIDLSELSNKYDPQPGKLVFNNNFNFSYPEAQQFVVDMCNDIYTASEQVDGENLPLIRSQLGKDELNCFMLGFKEHLEKNANNSFPTAPDEFNVQLAEWFRYRRKNIPKTGWPPSQQYESHVHVENNELIAFVIEANSTMTSFDTAYLPTRAQYRAWDQWSNSWAEKTPTSIQPWYHTAGGQVASWVFMHTQEVLIFNAFLGVGISLLISFIILTISTMNPYIALLAIVDISCVVVVILGFIQVFGWKLGQIESIATTILVGLAVDYVVHVANAYMESKKWDRQSRVKNALVEMGGTVLGGAVTSLGASFFLLFCNFQFFAKFGVFMFLTIGLSFLFVFFFFVPMLLLIGPERDCGNLRMITKCNRFCDCHQSKDDTIRPV